MKVFLLIFSTIIFARPIGYKDAYSVNIDYLNEMQETTIHYSPTHNYSIGFKSFNNIENNYNGIYGSYLLGRVNKKDSQANFFVFGGLGSNSRELIINSGLRIDYETQRFFVMHQSQNYDLYNLNKTRVGIAPYIGSYEGVNTWVMIESNNIISKTIPLIRLYYQNILLEYGKINSYEMLNLNTIFLF